MSMMIRWYPMMSMMIPWYPWCSMMIPWCPMMFYDVHDVSLMSHDGSRMSHDIHDDPDDSRWSMIVPWWSMMIHDHPWWLHDAPWCSMIIPWWIHDDPWWSMMILMIPDDSMMISDIPSWFSIIHDDSHYPNLVLCTSRLQFCTLVRFVRIFLQNLARSSSTKYSELDWFV